MPTSNQLDLQTLGSQLVMLKNLSDHCIRLLILSMPNAGRSSMVHISAQEETGV